MENTLKFCQTNIKQVLAEKILVDLQQIQKFTNQSHASVFASGILNSIRKMRDKIPLDPFLEVIMALHDAMAFKNSWLDYNADQYQGAYNILRKLINIQNIQKDKIEKAILGLERLGFDTLPFESSSESVNNLKLNAKSSEAFNIKDTR